MNEINTEQLMAQMRVMAAQAQGERSAQPQQGADFGDLLQGSIDRVNELQVRNKMIQAYQDVINMPL